MFARIINGFFAFALLLLVATGGWSAEALAPLQSFDLDLVVGGESTDAEEVTLDPDAPKPIVVMTSTADADSETLATNGPQVKWLVYRDATKLTEGTDFEVVAEGIVPPELTLKAPQSGDYFFLALYGSQDAALRFKASPPEADGGDENGSEDTNGDVSADANGDTPEDTTDDTSDDATGDTTADTADDTADDTAEIATTDTADDTAGDTADAADDTAGDDTAATDDEAADGRTLGLEKYVKDRVKKKSIEGYVYIDVSPEKTAAEIRDMFGELSKEVDKADRSDEKDEALRIMVDYKKQREAIIKKKDGRRDDWEPFFENLDQELVGLYKKGKFNPKKLDDLKLAFSELYLGFKAGAEAALAGADVDPSGEAASGGRAASTAGGAGGGGYGGGAASLVWVRHERKMARIRRAHAVRMAKINGYRSP